MALPELLSEIEGRGVTLMVAPVEPRLRFRPASALTPDLVEGLREHKAAILEALEHRAGPAPTIRNAGEVLELARARLGEMAPEYQTEAPYPSPEPGRDPLAHLHTPKARFFRGVRRRDQERRKREGLPPWIRLVDGGGASA